MEEELILISSCFIQKSGTEESVRQPSSSIHKLEFDLDKYSSRNVDRFGVLHDIWSKQAEFMDLKRQLLDCFLEVYHHVTDLNERKKIAKVSHDLSFLVRLFLKITKGIIS